MDPEVPGGEVTDTPGPPDGGTEDTRATGDEAEPQCSLGTQEMGEREWNAEKLEGRAFQKRSTV